MKNVIHVKTDILHSLFSGDRDLSRPIGCDFCVGGDDAFDGGDAGPSGPSRAASALAHWSVNDQTLAPE